MGQTGSKVINRISNSLSFGGQTEEGDDLDQAMVIRGFKGGTALVYSRRGSMYFDEDGDLAHEFYVEVVPKRKGGQRHMRKVNTKHLTPQGEVQYPHPRLHVDFPIIMYQG